MHFSLHNEKVGNALIVSRPVGTTCPSACPFLGNGCYAEKTEARFPVARAAAQRNLVVSERALTRAVEHAEREGLPIRIHERGDMGRSDRLDMPYIRIWRRVLEKFRSIQARTWTYTHFYRRAIATLPCNVYASVHNESDYAKAKRAGFRLFAWVLPLAKRKGGSPDAPKYVDTPSGRALVCPEQRLGRKRVTCETCKWCITGKGDVAFLTH